ncbi:hypothetical protein FHN55_20125 [Streptomyces sp. NP160]|uniref:hypothetical protein n=1 Tax=Streptomyces sp. NP160 TaxID=2586637 RepID=UPI001118424F|nr:hypothetical protein [Streptomyces sp. NP160]TNM59806.1 hypothetical protein FHN55_20125 [Streptomyces sp. NP160]
MQKRNLLVLAAVVAIGGCTEPRADGQEAQESATSVAEPGVSQTPGILAPLQLVDGTTVGIDGDPPELIGDVGYGGTLTTVAGGCWGFDDGIGTTTVFFLVGGTTLTNDGLGVITTDGVELRVGDKVYGGGYGVRPGSEVELEWRAARPECFEGRRAGVYVGLNKVSSGAG